MALNSLSDAESQDGIRHPAKGAEDGIRHPGKGAVPELMQKFVGAIQRDRHLLADASNSEANLALINEVAAEAGTVAPDLEEATKAIRHFAGRYLSQEEPNNAVIGVVSSLAGEGRTTVALGLAGALAEMYGRIVLVELETDQAAPTLGAEMGLKIPRGLRDYLHFEASLASVVVATQKEHLWFLPAGDVQTQSSRLDATARTRHLLTELSNAFDVVVVDLPPLLTSEPTPALLAGLTGVVLVVSAGSSTTDEVKQAMELCGSVPVKGVLLNKVRPKAPGWLSSLFRS